jgi:hypothetical protein
MRLRPLILVAALGLAAPDLSAQPSSGAAATPAQEAAQLVDRAVQAFGGPGAVDAVTALEVKGSGTRRVQADDLPVTTVTRYFFPDRYYQELILPMGTMKTVLAPDAAFIVAGEGALPLPDSERAAMKKLMQRNVVAVLKGRHQPGFQASVVGSDTVEGTAVKLVKITRDGDSIVLGIDPRTGQVRQTRWDSMGGLSATGTLVVSYSDYQTAGLISTFRYPFRAVATMDGKPAFSQVVEHVVVNPRLDEALFKQPPGHAMFPGVEDLPGKPGEGLTPPPTLLPRPSPSPTMKPRE